MQRNIIRAALIILPLPVLYYVILPVAFGALGRSIDAANFAHNGFDHMIFWGVICCGALMAGATLWYSNIGAMANLLVRFAAKHGRNANKANCLAF